MNIAIILPYLKAGGTERQASYIANDLSEKGHNVTVVCVEKNGTFLDLFDVSVVYLNSKNSNLKILKNLNRLSGMLLSLNIDVVLSRAWSVNLLTSQAAAKADIPSVLFLSGSIDLSHHSFIKRKIHKYVLDKASQIISVSHQAKQNCVKWLQTKEKKITVVHNGVDTEEVLKKADADEVIPEYLKEIQTLKIVFVGRLIHRKGLDLLLKAISVIHHKGERMNLIVVGDGDEKSVYLDMAEELGISEYVHFVGEQKNPFPFMKMADIFVLPSRSEGFPNVLLEAMAVGLPVIASNCETGPNEILNGDNGLLTLPESVPSLTENLLWLLHWDKVRKEIGEKGKRSVMNSFQLRNQLNLIEKTIKDTYEATKDSKIT